MGLVATIGLTATLIAVSLLSLAHGALEISLGEALRILFSHLALTADGPFDPAEFGVVTEIRAPRTLLAIIVGGGLSVAGSLMQGLFRNPLADPGLLGVSSGAALGAAFVIVLGTAIGIGTTWAIPLAAFAGAAVSTIAVTKLSSRGGRTVVATMLLAGIAINALAGAGTGVLVYLADDDQLRDLTFWTLGSFGGAGWGDVQLSLALLVVPCVLCLRLGRALNVMLLGESEAQMLGIDIQQLKYMIVFGVCIVVGTSVALCGIIGFVGLVVPHLCRLMLGPDNRIVLPSSALLGAALLLGADLVSRLIIIPAELPIGIVTSLVGGPFFLFLLSRDRPGSFS